MHSRQHRDRGRDGQRYAAQNPREFIAEVFLGLVYGNNYSPDVLEMYDGLGGPSRAQAPTGP